MPAATTLPDHQDFTRRLHDLDDNPHLVEYFYPRLLKRAGTRATGRGFATALHLAVTDYTAEQPLPVRDTIDTTLRRDLDMYVRAVIDDPAVQRDALDALAESERD